MPTYDFECVKCGVEVSQKLSIAEYADLPDQYCDEILGYHTPENREPQPEDAEFCGGRMRRVFSPPGVSIS